MWDKRKSFMTKHRYQYIIQFILWICYKQIPSLFQYKSILFIARSLSLSVFVCLSLSLSLSLSHYKQVTNPYNNL